MLAALYSEEVINDDQKEVIQKKSLKKDKVFFLFDDVIKPGLKVGITTKYDNLIKVMKASDDEVANHLADLLEGKSYNHAAFIIK